MLKPDGHSPKSNAPAVISGKFHANLYRPGHEPHSPAASTPERSMRKDGQQRGLRAKGPRVWSHMTRHRLSGCVGGWLDSARLAESGS
jgi:hypothetical protein